MSPLTSVVCLAVDVSSSLHRSFSLILASSPYIMCESNRSLDVYRIKISFILPHQSLEIQTLLQLDLLIELDEIHLYWPTMLYTMQRWKQPQWKKYRHSDCLFVRLRDQQLTTTTGTNKSSCLSSTSYQWKPIENWSLVSRWINEADFIKLNVTVDIRHSFVGRYITLSP